MNLMKLHNELELYNGVNWLIKYNIIKNERNCPKYKKIMHLSIHRSSYRCYNKKCKKEISIRKNTIFSKSKLKIEKIILLLYCFVNKYSTETINKELMISRTTIAKFKRLYRNVLKEIIMNKKNRMIGGYKHIVQIDEMYVGHRKYGKGRSAAKDSQCWFVGGIDTKTKEIFYKKVDNRNKRTLHNVIWRYVKIGSIIYTDSWGGYNDIEEYFKHCTINHSKEFVNGNIHTQNIEATHSAVRRILRMNGSNSGSKELQFNEYVWRKSIKEEKICSKILSRIYPIYIPNIKN